MGSDPRKGKSEHERVVDSSRHAADRKPERGELGFPVGESELVWGRRLSALVQTFVTLPPGQLDEHVPRALEDLAIAVGAHRVGIAKLDPLTATHVWPQHAAEDAFRVWDQLGTLAAESNGDLSSIWVSAEVLPAPWRNAGIEAVLSIPLSSAFPSGEGKSPSPDILWFASGRRRAFPDPVRQFLQAAASILGMAMTHARQLLDLKRVATKYHTLLHTLPDLVFQLRRDTTCIDYYCSEFVPLLVPPSEFLGRRIAEILPADLAERTLLAVQRAIDNDSRETFEYSLVLEGATHYYEARIMPSGNEEVLIFIRNVTDHRRAEQAMQTASRLEATARFAGGIAHTLNNLMAGVLGNAELLEAETKLTGDSQVCLGEIIASAREAGVLTQQLIGFARGGKYHPRVQDINEIVCHTRSMSDDLRRAAVIVNEACASQPLYVEVDRTQMQHVLANLLLNAHEALKDRPDGQIRLRTWAEDVAGHSDLPDGSYVVVEIADNGEGIPQEFRPYVFEPFRTTRPGKRGLGLAAVHGIVKNHGGDVRIASEPGAGTTVSVYLPAVDPPSAALLKTPASGIRRTTGQTILVIDDQEVVVNPIARALERLGYTVLKALDGSTALRYVREHPEPIALALLDLHMPGMDGFTLYPLLTMARPNMPILLCSGYELDEVAQDLLAKGADGFLAKPFDLTTLRRTIRQILDPEPEGE